MLPLIDRNNVSFKNEYGINNIGFAEGVLSDGRPYRAELYIVDHILQMSVYISVIGIEQDIAYTITDYLEKEGLFKLDIKRVCEVNKILDRNGNSFFEAVVIFRVEDEYYGTTDLKFLSFPYEKEELIEVTLKEYLDKTVRIKTPGQKDRTGQVIGYNAKESTHLIVSCSDHGKKESLRVEIDNVEMIEG